MDVNTKLLSALGVLCLFVIISGVFGIIYTQSINEKLNIITTKTAPSISAVDDMIIALLQMNIMIKEIVAEPSEIKVKELAKEFQALNKDFQKSETILSNLIVDDNLKITFNAAVKQKQMFYDTAQEIIAIKTGNGEALPGYPEELKAKSNDAATKITNILEEISIRAYLSNKNANAQSYQAVRSTIFFLSLTTILSLVSALVIGIYLSRSIIRPIDELSEAAMKLSMGNFDVSVKESGSNDEITHLKLVFNKMVKSLQKLIKESPGLKKYIDLSVQHKQVAQQEYKLSQKSVYLIKDRTPHRAYDIVMDKVSKGMAGLCITRDDPEQVKEKYGIIAAEWIWLTDIKDKMYQTTSNLQIILKKINDFTAKNSPSIILIDRIDYLITKHTFDQVLKFITAINDRVMTTNTVMLIPIDPAYMNPRDLSLLEKELKELPIATEKERVSDELMKILAFIKNRRALNRLASFKDVSKEFNITAPTTKKKLRELHELHLIRIAKQGRNKLLEPTPQAEKQV